jgi:DNA-binding NarL/FixJ family response regulator
MNVLIADDDRRFRDVLRQLLAREPEVSVSEARDGDEALRLARELHPSVVLMDITMPRVDGLEATRRIKALQPDTKVIIVTLHAEEPYRQAARESGADGFLLKKALMGELIPMIRRLVPHHQSGAGDSHVS